MPEPVGINTENDSMVAVRGEQIVLLRVRNVMSREEALRLAAWLVALADEDGTFSALLDAVMNT
jgi:hypothetical protein